MAANTIIVDVGVADVDNGLCSLVEAIENANDTNMGQPNTDCAAGDFGGADEITLPVGDYTLTTIDNIIEGNNGLPSITSQITINGGGEAGTIIERSGSAPEFRLFHVAVGGGLRLMI